MNASIPVRAAAGAYRIVLWKVVCAVLAIAYAAPICVDTYSRLVDVSVQARARLVEQHRLWELEPLYRGPPQTWTRMAAHILNDRQLMERVAIRHGSLADEIELDYRRDLTIARGEVVIRALLLWSLPVGALFVLGTFVLRTPPRPPTPAPKAQPASVLDPRYRPPPRP